MQKRTSGRRCSLGCLPVAAIMAWWGAVAAAPAPASRTQLLAQDNLVAWLVAPPYDSKQRSAEARAALLQRLAFRRYVYIAGDEAQENAKAYDAEIDALQARGIELFAWRVDYDADDPKLTAVLEAVARHHIRPQLWVTGAQLKGAKPPPGLEKLSPFQATVAMTQVWRRDLAAMPQTDRIEREATRIYALRERAARFGLKVALYNHNGWFGMEPNQLEILRRLRDKGVTDVGLVYNFSHARDDLHDDTVGFARLWGEIKPYVVAVNVTGMGSEKRFLYPSQGNSELTMLRTIQQSGWHGPIGVVGEQGGDAEVTLGNCLVGLKWLAAELRSPGSSGGKPFPDVSDPSWARTLTSAMVVKREDNQPIQYPWGRLTWFVSKERGNSDTMTIGEADIKPGLSTGRHYHPNCDEVLHVLQGEILQSVGDQSLRLKQGDTVSIPAGVVHGTQNVGGTDAILMLSYSSADRRVVGE